MSALGLIRSMGVGVEIRDGGLALRPALQAAVDVARAHKPAIIAELQAEVFDGASYESSGCFYWVERVYDAAYSLKRYGIDVSKLLALLMEVDRAMTAKFDRETFDKQLPQIREVAQAAVEASGYLLTGHALHEAVKREVDAMNRNLGAFA